MSVREAEAILTVSPYFFKKSTEGLSQAEANHLMLFSLQ